MKFYLLILLILVCSCKTFQLGNGGSQGGSVPTAQDMDDYIKRSTTFEKKQCGDLTIDIPRPQKNVIIYPSGQNPWKEEYSKAISEQFKKPYMQGLRTEKINESDLKLIHCEGYNEASEEQKEQFWILFLSAMSKPESNFNSHEEFREQNGTVSTGMLQIDAKASNDWCEILAKEKNNSTFSKKDMHTPETNLQCGLLMMQWQITGVPHMPEMTMRHPELKGHLFTGKKFWYWAVLADTDKNKEVIDWFRVHAQRQLPFCNKANPIDGHIKDLSSKYIEVNCNGFENASDKKRCEENLLTTEYKNGSINPRYGENPIDDDCRSILNNSRGFKDFNPAKEYQRESKTINK